MRGEAAVSAIASPRRELEAELCVLLGCHHLLIALPVRCVARLLLSDELTVVQEGAPHGERRGRVVSVAGELVAAWNLGAMLGLGPVSVACVVVQLPHAGGEMRLALEIGACLRVQRFRCEEMVPPAIFHSRTAAFPGAFDASAVRRGSHEANVGLWLEPKKLWTPGELDESRASVKAAKSRAGAS